MNKPIRSLLGAVLAASMMFAAGTASADRGRGDRDHGRHEWRDHGHDRHDDRGHRHWRQRRHEHEFRHHRHAHDHDRHRSIVRERVIIRERPIYRHYESRYPVYAEPGVVIGVNLPPLVIPFPRP
ncbi:MAG: hypothetical protein KDH15_01960 [Rhodocyclaceae bacterium]|nr:hypothetical protein [Rhodocyclaceae bacterium]